MELLEKAISDKDLLSFLIGKDEYYFVCPYADMPTNPHDVQEAIIEYYKIKQDKIILKLYVDSIITLSLKDEMSWMAMYYLVDIIRNHSIGFINYGVDAVLFSNKILENITGQKKYLLNNKKWVGADYNNGLWEDVVRMRNNISENYSLNLITIT